MELSIIKSADYKLQKRKIAHMKIKSGNGLGGLKNGRMIILR
jgi:hypothetical protein